ncbi:hypothetical protein L226DRAFT_497007 [Lentinus tigrinus ALCF2SS1-7]|uniref:uncharacterized protein n=1 Tax=Lentinus tigrinus ALCF2SS1-7 TaxID=1328758 RepID=UPI0011661199|nr:hypothetical protein L226DRAFT_497007 [Lentinus tigrinus ALCF2SS1-7]
MVAQTVAPGAAFKSLSSNDVIQFLLADIPIFTVGILAFGTLTFFFLMKRVDRWVFCLHMSVLLAFLAAILDLTQLLSRGRDRQSDTDDAAAGVNSLISAREVFYAFANTLRFLFYWGFVAMIPLGETIPEGNHMHSGSWRRWGLVGLSLKWSTLVILFVMAILQIVYRVVAEFKKIGPVYEAEAALEIILSAVFILKLLLNTWARYPVGSTTQSKGKMLVQYAPIIVALLFSLWIAVGNVILFEFTETALGRFMRAVELYVVLVYMLTISFHHLRHLSFFPIYRPATKGPSRSNTFNRSSIEKVDNFTDVKVAPEPVKVDNLMEALEEQYRVAQAVPPTVERNSAKSAKVESANTRQSMAARLSTWLGGARPLPRPPQEVQVQPWDIDTERGPSPVAPNVPRQWYPEEKPRLDALVIPSQVELDEDEQRGVSPLPNFPTGRPPRVVEPAPPSPVVSLKPNSSTMAVEDAELDSAKTPIPNRDWQDIEYSNAVRYSGANEDMLADALKQNYYQQQGDSASSIASNIQVISPPSDDEVSRPNSLAASQYAPSPYPMSPLASAVVTPLPRSRPLPPMPIPNRTSMLASPKSPIPPDSARSSNMSILLRQQNELDESIAALRLFSPTKQAFGMEVSQPPVEPSTYYTQYALEYPQQPGGLSPIPSVGTQEFTPPSPDLTLATPGPDRIPQSSGQSEFHFDGQPPLNRSSMDSGVIPASLPSAGKWEESRPASPAGALVPPPMPVSRFSDASSIGQRSQRKGVDSMGTQYDITSFVGNLTVPVNPKDSIMSASSAVLSDDGSVAVATVARPGILQLARPTFITQTMRMEGPLAPVGLPAQPAPSTSPIRSAASRALPQIPKPVSQTQTQTQTPPVVAEQPAAPRFRRAVGLPARPRLSVVNLTPVSEKVASPSDTATLVTSPQSGSGTPMTGKAW